MKWFDELKAVPLTVFGFYFVVISSVILKAFSFEIVVAILGLAAIHYLIQYSRTKEEQNQTIKDLNYHVQTLHKELLSQRTDISKLNLLFGTIQNQSNPFRAKMTTDSTFDEDFKIPGKTSNNKGHSK